jgi:thiamine biosynthesis protein ThiS
LTTGNIPVIRKLINLPFGGDTPFKAEVYFVNHKVFPNIKWGTREPIPFRDTELMLVRLRAFGIMSYKVEDSQLFVNKIVGTQRAYSTDQINDFLKGIVIGRLTDFLGENLKSVFDLPQYYDEIGAGTKTRLKDDFAKYGMALEDFIINAITPPEEVQKKIDERSGMAAMGDLDQYMKYKAAQAMHDAAKSEGGGGLAGAGMGAGVGLGMGMMMPGMVAQATQSGAQQQAGAATVACPKCNAQNAQGAKFCSTTAVARLAPARPIAPSAATSWLRAPSSARIAEPRLADLTIFVDGLEQEVPDQATVADVLEQLSEPAAQALVELNGVFVHKSSYSETVLKSGDRLEVIYPAFGG